MKKYHVHGREIRACGKGCRDSFQVDRDCGLIYPSYQWEDGKLHSVEETSIAYNMCAYCGANLNKA